MTKTWFKDTPKNKQFYNPLRNYTTQNAETRSNPLVRKSPPKRTASAISAKSAETVCPTKTASPRNQTKSPHFTRRTSQQKPASHKKLVKWLAISISIRDELVLKGIFKQTEFRFAVFEQALADSPKNSSKDALMYVINLIVKTVVH